MYSLGCDIGGTFTDFTLLDQGTGEVVVHKCLTTPQDPSEGVRVGVGRLMEGVPGFLSETRDIIHGTTLVINAIIERKGAKTGLITTKGFRDVLEIRRGLRYDIYDLQFDFPPPLIPRYLRRELDERIYSNGEVLREAQGEEIGRVLRELVSEGVESIAVCLLHSYKNPVHEELVKRIALEVCPHIPISLSSEVLPEIREYERTSTAVVNAYTNPLFSRYLRKLHEKLESLGFSHQLFLLLSSGGIVPAQAVENFPVQVIESGPVGGVILSRYLGKITREKNDLFSFDMGGTTAKSCLIQNGVLPKSEDYEVARMERFKKGSGIPVQIPVIDMLEIGAGGGSIAEINRFGLLQVGPQSSGADPGPVCYGQGGKDPCVTDADLVLGYLNQDYFLGGEMRLDLDAAQKAIEERIAKPLKMGVIEAAWGIHNIVNENMALAAKMHIVERGGDPLRTTLIAFGGAGPVHAYGLAKKLRMQRILIPQRSGVASAMGFFVAPFNYEVVHTYKVVLEESNLSEIERAFEELEGNAARFLPKTDRPELIRCQRSMDMRYVGQGYEINIPLSSHKVSNLKKGDISKIFNSTYEQIYGRTCPEKVDVMHLRVMAMLPDRPFSFKKFSKRKKVLLRSAIKGQRKAYSSLSNSYVDFTVYDRYELVPGATFDGPAIIEEKESTTVLERDATASVDAYGTIVVTFRRKQR
jgi:N-methylhydantoinase A/oxoprolinase/acetone carboxylase beta subunit